MIIERPLVINQPQIGKLIRELRLATGLTQEKFAVKLGVTEKEKDTSPQLMVWRRKNAEQLYSSPWIHPWGLHF